MNAQMPKSITRWLTVPLMLALVACGGGSKSASQSYSTSTAIRSLEVSSSVTTAPAGTQLSYSALAHLANGSTVDVTADSDWSASNALLVRLLSTPGALVTVGVGDTNVSASYGGLVASAPLSITPGLVLSMSVNPSSAPVAVGATQPLVAYAVLSSSTEDVTLVSQWTSSDPAVASVDANGVVTGRAVGAATISVSYSGAVKTASVAVSTAISSGGSGSGGGSGDGSGSGGSGSGSGSDTGGSGTGGTPNGNGACPSTSHTLTSIVVWTTTSDSSAPAGYSEQFHATGYYADCTQADITGLVQWSSDTGVVVIDPVTGAAVAVSSGATNIRASLDGITSAPYPFLVTDAVLTGIDVVPGFNPGDDGYDLLPVYTTIAKGTSAFYTAWANYSDGSQLDVTNEMAWSSSAPDAIAFTTAGIATGVAPVVNATVFADLRSDSTIVCPAGVTCSGSVQYLTVTGANLVSIAVTTYEGTASLVTLPPAPFSEQFVALGTFDDGSVQDLTIDPALSWSISSPNGASFVQGFPGMLQTGSATSATVTATMGGVSGNISVVVSSATISGIAVTPASATLPATVGLQLGATALYSDGSQYSISPMAVRWSSSNSSVASVSSSGYVSALTLGTATITAQLPGYGLSATSNISVVRGTLKQVVITDVRGSQTELGSAATTVGARARMFSTGLYDVGTGTPQAYDITRQCAWKSSAKNVATVQKTKSGALVSGLHQGSATITARKGAPKATNMDTVGFSVTQ